MHLLPIYRTPNSAGDACMATSIKFFPEQKKKRGGKDENKRKTMS
jgi:hypothetical protein